MYTPPHIKESHKGMLHRALGIKEGEKISVGDLMAAKRRAKKTGDTKLEKQAVFAENARGWNHGHK